VRYGERVTRSLIEQLSAADVETRKAAVIALGRIGDPEALPALVRAMTDDDELTIVAAGALGKLGDRRAFDALIEMIGRPDAAVRQASVAAINSLGHPEMAERAVALLKDPDPFVRESAVRISGYFGYAECAGLLFERCRDEDENVRRAAIEHITYLEDERVIPTLVDALQAAPPRVRAAAAAALGQAEPREALPHLLAALNDPDPWVRYFAARSIGRHEYEESLDALAEAAKNDTASHVRIAAVDSLGWVDGPGAVAVLATFVESADRDLARAAVRALGRIDHPNALPLLLEALRSHDALLRAETLQSFSKPTSNEAITQMQWTAAADPDPQVAQAAIDALARMGTPESVSALIDLTAEAPRREASVNALARLAENKIELVESGVKHAQPSVRRAVIDALRRMKHPLASRALSGALDDEDASVRLAAVNALAHLGNRGAERKMRELMRTDPDTAVRRAAQKALSR
jgi:HEAT repeat protein